MKGDFSRQTFDQTKHYTAVLMQQGRVQLDADWNEQQAIYEYWAETQAQDVIGPSGTPTQNPGFEIAVDPSSSALSINAGHYYVDGILCENERKTGVRFPAGFAQCPIGCRYPATGGHESRDRVSGCVAATCHVSRGPIVA